MPGTHITARRTPKSVQWAAEFRRRIRAGDLSAGDRLPSVVEMKQLHGISRPVADRLLYLLEAENLIVRQPGRGIYVADLRADTRSKSLARVLGINLPAEEQNELYYARLMRGAREMARQNSVELLLYHENSVVGWEKVDGSLSCSSIAPVLPPFMPSVSLLHTLPGHTNIVTDDFEAMQILTSHLIQLGHRRIAYMTAAVAPVVWPDNFCLTVPTMQRRLAGYKSALVAAGIAIEEGWVRSVNVTNERDFSRPEPVLVGPEVLGRNAMEKWLREGWASLGCTALAVQNDGAAVGVIEVLQKAGIRVPHDVSIVGFDGLDGEKYFRPSLTTMCVPLEEIGSRGVRTLVDLIAAPIVSSRGTETVDIIVPSSLRTGDSTAPPRIKRRTKKEN